VIVGGLQGQPIDPQASGGQEAPCGRLHDLGEQVQPPLAFRPRARIRTWSLSLRCSLLASRLSVARVTARFTNHQPPRRRQTAATRVLVRARDQPKGQSEPPFSGGNKGGVSSRRSRSVSSASRAGGIPERRVLGSSRLCGRVARRPHRSAMMRSVASVSRQILFALASSDRSERLACGLPGGEQVAYRLALRYAGRERRDAFALAHELAKEGLTVSIEFFGKDRHRSGRGRTRRPLLTRGLLAARRD